MDDSELEQRKARAANETLVIAPTEGGFRVYSPANITHIFMVSGIPDLPQCNCGDFEAKKSNPEWRCKHILAVLNQRDKRQGSKPTSETPQTQEQPDSAPNASEPASITFAVGFDLIRRAPSIWSLPRACRCWPSTSASSGT